MKLAFLENVISSDLQKLNIRISQPHVRWFVRLPGEGPFACAATNRLLCVLTRNRRASAFPLPCRVETYDLARGAPMFRVDAEEGIRRVDGAGRHLYVRTFDDNVHDLEWYARP